MLDRIEELMKGYDYVQEKVMNSTLDITVDDYKNKIFIKNWHDFKNVNSKETCMGLCLRLAKDLYEENKNIDLSICDGTEPNYFFDNDEAHSFLVYTNKNNSYIVDPSFKIIENLDNSKYKVKNSVNPKKNFWISDDILVRETNDISFCFHESYLISLRVDVFDNEYFSLGMTNKDGDYRYFSLDSMTCSILRNENENINGLLTSLENSNIKYDNRIEVNKYKIKLKKLVFFKSSSGIY